MIMIDWCKTVVLKRYAQFDGRAGRAEYWWFVLATAIIGVPLQILGYFSSAVFIAYFFLSLALLVPSLAVIVRRLHDTNKSGWFMLIGLIPLIGFIVVIVFLATSGDTSANKYGPPDSGVPVA
jgi:uncharacterized membrane protein YhaH (DUF805 family)